MLLLLIAVAQDPPPPWDEPTAPMWAWVIFISTIMFAVIGICATVISILEWWKGRKGR